MIADSILIFFIILIFTCLFEDRLIPLAIIFGFALIQIITYVPTITTQNEAYIAILYVMNLLYIFYRVFKTSQDIHNMGNGQ